LTSHFRRVHSFRLVSTWRSLKSNLRKPSPKPSVMAYVARLRGFKSALTTRINIATAHYDAVHGLQHPTSQQLEDPITASNRVQEQFDCLQEFCIERITAAADDDEADPWQTELNQAETRANTATARIILLVGEFNAPPPAAAAPAAATGAAPPRCRPNDALKPERLTPVMYNEIMSLN
jgi:hypothetical protein